MSSTVAGSKIRQENLIASEFDYKSATRAILPRLAATTHESDRLRRLTDDAADALRDIRPVAHDHAEAVRRI